MATINTNFVNAAALAGAQSASFSTLESASSIIRNQQVLATYTIDEAVLGNIEAVYLSPRVVSQTPKAGTVVSRGTTINLVFANGYTLPADVIVGGTAKFKGRALGKVYDDYVKDDAVLTSLVLKYGDDKNLSEAERSQVSRTLAQKGLEVGDDFDGVMTSLGAANTFNGQAI